MSHITRSITEIAHCGIQYRAEQMKALDLRSVHANYLVEICAEPGISQNRLSQRLYINKSNVARQVAVLEEKGFVLCKVSDEDKRVMRLYPTEKSMALLPEIQKMFNAWEAHLTENLTEADKQILTALLAQIKERANTWTEVDSCAET